MTQDLDRLWLEKQADDEETRRWIRRLAEWRKNTLERNELPLNRMPIALRLGGYEIWVEAEAAFCALEVYQEIFRDRDHFLVPEFEGGNLQVIVDLGANYGFYALRAKERNPGCRLFCVEPNPYVFPLLKKNMAVNRIGDAVLINKAVAASEGKIPFDLIRQIHSISGRGVRNVPRGWMKEEFIETVEVDALPLANLLISQEISSVDVLKVDVEGMEMEVLNAATEILRFVRRVVVEYHSSPLREALLSFLTGRGFTLVKEQNSKGQPYYGELYFVNAASAPWCGVGEAGDGS